MSSIQTKQVTLDSTYNSQGVNGTPAAGDSLTKVVGNVWNVITDKINNNPFTLTYTSGVLTGISYSDGSSKTLSYTSGVLTGLVYNLANGRTITKTFNYTSGVLTSVTVTGE